MKQNFIPIEVYEKNNIRKIWYIDLNEMSYSQLTDLRRELIGTISTRYLDRVINNMISDYTHTFANNKALKRDFKHNTMLKKKRAFKKKGGRR